MVQGVLVCGTFLTKRALTVIASLLLLVLILGCISLGIGLAMYCYGQYSYYDSCTSTKLALIINGSVIIGLTVIGLFVVAVLACRLKNVPVTMAPTFATQPYTVTSVYGHATAVHPGSAVHPPAGHGQPHQIPIDACFSGVVHQGHLYQSDTQKPNPQAAHSITQPRTSQPSM